MTPASKAQGDRANHHEKQVFRPGNDFWRDRLE